MARGRPLRFHHSWTSRRRRRIEAADWTILDCEVENNGELDMVRFVASRVTPGFGLSITEAHLLGRALLEAADTHG